MMRDNKSKLFHSEGVRMSLCQIIKFGTAHTFLSLVNECSLQNLDVLDHRAIEHQSSIHRGAKLNLQYDVVVNNKLNQNDLSLLRSTA